MTPEEIQALLEKQAQTFSVSLSPITDALKAITETQAALAASVVSQGETLKTVASRVDQIESEPVRKGVATTPPEPTAEPEIADPIEEIKRQIATPEFAEYAQKDPNGALKAFLSMFDVGGRGNILLDLMRDEGSISALSDQSLSGAGWRKSA